MPRKQLAESMILCKGNNTPALKCCGTKRISEFYDSWSPFSDGKVNYCKDCCKSIFEYYLEQTHSIQAALYFTLQKMDVPFIKEIYTQMNKLASDGDINGKKTPITISGYMASLQRKTSMKTIWTDFSATDIDLSEINSKLQNDNVKKSEMEKFEFDWGIQDSIEDYKFLEETFNKYTEDIELDGQIQIDKYRDLYGNTDNFDTSVPIVEDGLLNNIYLYGIDKKTNQASYYLYQKKEEVVNQYNYTRKITSAISNKDKIIIVENVVAVASNGENSEENIRYTFNKNNDDTYTYYSREKIK